MTSEDETKPAARRATTAKRSPSARRLSALARQAVRGSRTTFTAAAEAYERNPSGDDLHDVRVALRRAAAVGALFHGLPAKGDGRVVEEIADELRRTLSDQRQREVSAELLAGLTEGASGMPARDAASALGLDVGAPAPRIREEAERLASSLEAWAKTLTRWRPDADDERRVGARVQKRIRRARRRVLEIGVPRKKTLHRLRVAGKALRYGLELVEAYEPQAGAVVKASKRFQDALGDAHDWAALDDEIRDLRKSATGEVLARLEEVAPKVAAERARTLREAREEARKFLKLLERRGLSLDRPALASK